jgi:hypothetical protein
MQAQHLCSSSEKATTNMISVGIIEAGLACRWNRL